MERLRTRGIGGVRVLSLAQDLKVSRGSFYWHFTDHAELLAGMLEYWEREMTDIVIERAKTARGGPGTRLRRAAETIVADELTRYDAAVRSWAQGDTRAHVVFERVVRKRQNYITALFRDAGFPEREASDRADIVVVYLMGEAAIHSDQSIESRLRLVRRQVRFLIA